MDVSSVFRGLLSIAIIMAICYLCSADRKAVRWRMVGAALLTQLILALCVSKIGPITSFVEVLGKCFVKLQDFVNEGMAFLLGSVFDIPAEFVKRSDVAVFHDYVFIFRALPTIIFFSALSSLFYYWGIIPAVVKVLSKGMKRLYGVSGSEGIVATGAVFLGQAGAPVLAERYIPTMNKSEIYFIMLTGMANVGAALLPSYADILAAGDVALKAGYVKDFLTASVMAVPGSIAVAKLLMPQTEQIVEGNGNTNSEEDPGVLGVLSEGTSTGIKIIVGIAGMLLIFISLVSLVNYIMCNIIGKYTHLNDLIQNLPGGEKGFTIECLLGWVFSPITYIVGIDSADIVKIGGLLGKKLVMNEFVGFSNLSELARNGMLANPRTLKIASYMLCSFANFSSVGICMAAIGSLAPNQKGVLAKYAWRALFGAFWVSCISAAMVGMFC